jgi:hypothetical protein
LSGVETVKIIVNAEKEAARLLAESHNKALEIRKKRDVLIEQQLQQALQTASKEAKAMVQSAESEARAEAEKYESNAKSKIAELVSTASAKKREAIDELVALVMESGA